VATPIGHYLLGLSTTQIFGRHHLVRRKGPWLGVIACLPDLDILPGLIFSDLSRFHHGASHGLMAATVFSLLGSLSLGWRSLRSMVPLFLLFFLLYTSHIVLDFLTSDTGAPYGIPLFWPWISNFYQSPWPLLPNVQHTRAPLLSGHNLLLIAQEVLLFLPLYRLTKTLRTSTQPRSGIWIYGGWFLVALLASFVLTNRGL